MAQNKQGRKFIILITLLLVPGLLLILLSKAEHKFQYLPHYGPKTVLPIAGTDSADTLYHTVPDFSLTNQFGEPISWSDFEDQIVVGSFFFTSCPTICPIMTKHMVRLQWMLDDPSFRNVKFISYTVDPTTDTPEKLKAYGEKNGADFDRWTFATGDREEIYALGMEGYLLSAQEDDSAPGGYLHSGLFVLVDPDRHIRGFYDGTSAKEVDDLADDIRMLMKELKDEQSGATAS